MEPAGFGQLQHLALDRIDFWFERFVEQSWHQHLIKGIGNWKKKWLIGFLWIIFSRFARFSKARSGSLDRLGVNGEPKAGSNQAAANELGFS